jgi:hypothetical protein
MEHAKLNKMKGESTAQAFSRILEEEDGREFRRALGITKGYPDMMDTTPVSIEVGSTVTADDSKKAYDQLMALARRQHETSPNLSVQQLLARVMDQNPDLAAKAHRRPTASSVSYDAMLRNSRCVHHPQARNRRQGSSDHLSWR